jgi:hypothetical protein
MTQSRSIRLFLADGHPGGIITAEIVNWTGHVLVAPQSRLADLVKRPEAGRTGIYILSGTDPDGGHKPKVYVGETDNVGKRLIQHNKDEAKAFWEQTCIITSKDYNLTKAHARYLESRLISIATEAGRVKLGNGNEGSRGIALPEADIADMEFFIEQLRIVLPVLGMDFLKEPAKAVPHLIETPLPGSDGPAEFPGFELFSKKHDLRAEAREINGEFVVLPHSQAQATWIGSANHSYSTLYQQLIDDGVLVPEATGHLRFLKAYAFTSPSAAAAVVYGRASNGREAWCVKGTKKTYADWQEEQVAAAPQTGGEE